MSQRDPIVPGPSSQVHSSQNLMRQPSVIGVSVKASVPPPPQLAIEEMMLLLVVPTPEALPAQKASKFAPPSPSGLLSGSPVPSPCSLLPHSTIPFHTACSTPREPGNCALGVVLSLAVASRKLSKTRTSRCPSLSEPPIFEKAAEGRAGASSSAAPPKASAGKRRSFVFMEVGLSCSLALGDREHVHGFFELRHAAVGRDRVAL